MLIKTYFCYLLPLYTYYNRISFTLHYCLTLTTSYSQPVIIRGLVKPLSLYSYQKLNIVIRVTLLLKLINLPLSSTNANSSSCYCKLVGLHYALLFLLKLANLLFSNSEAISDYCYYKLVSLHYALLFLFKFTNLLLSSTKTVNSNKKLSLIFLRALQLFGYNSLLFLKLLNYKFELLCSYSLLLYYLN